MKSHDQVMVVEDLRELRIDIMKHVWQVARVMGSTILIKDNAVHTVLYCSFELLLEG